MKTPSILDIVQIDPELAEDGRSVALYGWTDDDNVVFMQSVNLPMQVTEAAFEDVRDAWRMCADPAAWWRLQ